MIQHRYFNLVVNSDLAQWKKKKKDPTVGLVLDYVNLRAKLNCKQRRSVTVSDQKGLITRGKTTNIRVAQPSADCLFPACIAPQNTGCLYMRCDKTSSILNFCFCGCWGGGEQGRRDEGMEGWGGVGGLLAVWPDGGTSDTASASPLHHSVPARQHAAICWIPPTTAAAAAATPKTLHPLPHPDAAKTTDNATS